MTCMESWFINGTRFVSLMDLSDDIRKTDNLVSGLSKSYAADRLESWIMRS